MGEELTLAKQTPKVENKKKEKKPKSLARKIIEWVLFGIFGVIFALIIAGNIDGMVHKKDNYNQSIRFGYGSFIVLTGSMEPDIKTKAAIITYREKVETIEKRFNEYKAKDPEFKKYHIDVTFMNVAIPYYVEPDTEDFKKGELIVTNQVMTHRLREIHVDTSVAYGKGRYIFVASGINHNEVTSLKGQYQTFTEKEYLGTVKFTNTALGYAFQFIVSPVGLIILLLVPAAYLIVVSSIDIFKTLKTSEEAESAPEGEKLSKISSEDRERLKKELLDEMIKAKKGEKDNANKN